jgi:muramoyltetrapeptide carboxypeptidase LdcA involved in peptidoglycan recycling
MSDNSLVLNTLVDRDQCRLLHGHPLCLGSRDFQAQRRRFLLWSEALRLGLPFPPEALPRLVPLVGAWDHPVTLVGGNLTALERLGETPWRPRPQGRTLLVESLSCPADQAAHRVAALLEDPWWSDVGGLALGRFTHADRDNPTWRDGLLSLLAPDLPVCHLPLVGHGSDAWTLPLAEPLALPR